MLFGDVGGFVSLVSFICSCLVNLLTYQNSSIHLIDQLYKSEEENQVTNKDRCQCYFRGYLQSILPRFCLRTKCLRLTRKELQLNIAQESLQHEMDLINLLQKVRYFDTVIKTLISKEIVS